MCGETKELHDFKNRKDSRDGRRGECRECSNKRKKSWRSKYTEKHGVPPFQESARRYQQEHLEDRAKLKAARVLKNKVLVLQAKYAPCTDCGNRFHPVCMDFDHVRGEKISSISRLMNQGESSDKLLAEISKCELVCANCHRLRTHAQDRAKPWEDKRRKYDRSTWTAEIPWDPDNYPEDLEIMLTLASKPLEP